MPAVQRLPYIEPSSQHEHFDLHQFWKRSLAVARGTGIAFSDYDRMHLDCRSAFSRHKRGIPVFAANDQQLADVIAHRCWQYCHGGRGMPPQLDKTQLKRMATLHLKRVKDQRRGGAGSNQDYRHQVHVLNTQRLGYAQMQAAVAYRSWRLLQPSTEVAASLGITAWNVRIMLWRLVAVARKLGYETYTKHRFDKQTRKYVVEKEQ